MKKKIKLIIIIILIGIIILAINLLSTVLSKTKFNEEYVNGNTAGNLYNGGLFCENDGIIYFANPDDGNKLYSMDLQGKNLKKISNDTVTYINADDHYIYYIRNNPRSSLNFQYFSFHQNALCRIDKDGDHLKILDKNPCNYASLLGNYIYYLHYDEKEASTLYRVKIDGSERKQILSYPIMTCCTNGKYIYYNDRKRNGFIHRFDTSNNSDNIFYECNSYHPIVLNNEDIYFLDGNNNNHLMHDNINYKNPTVLSKDSIDLYNILGSYIYYQKFSEDNSALCMIKNDGSDGKELRSGTHSNIHVTSNYIYFMDYRSKEFHYFSKSNPNLIHAFHPGVIED